MQASKTKPWVRCEGLSTSGQFTLWHEPPIRRSRPQKNIISSMIFHLRETPARGNAAPTLYTGSCQHAIVEVMFVATKVEHRKKKFFVQLLRLFMREVRQFTVCLGFDMLSSNTCWLAKCICHESVAETTGSKCVMASTVCICSMHFKLMCGACASTAQSVCSQ